MHAAIAAFVLFFAIAGTGEAADKTYVNPRFGTTITFPQEVFPKAEPAPENGDGQKWSAPDGATLAVWGQYNALDETPASLADSISKTIPKATYRKVGARWMVVSGFDQNMIVYHRAEISMNGTIHSFEMRYPAEQAKHYDRLAESIAESLIGP